MTLYETIDSLIDVTNVPEEKRQDKQYELARKAIHDELSSVENIEIACYHEAGHWSEAVLAAHYLGANPQQVHVIGPTIGYKQGKYDPIPTGLKIHGVESWQPQSENEVKAMARIAVAGAISVQHFRPDCTTCGDTNDIGRFDQFCRDAHMRLRGTIQPPHIYIDEAKEAVRKDFCDPVFVEMVRLKSEAIKSEQFGPVFLSGTAETQ